MSAPPSAGAGEIDVIANGEPRGVPDGITLAAFVEVLNLPGSRVAVELNGRLVPRERFPSVVLAAGDRLEVVTLVGGG